MKLAEALSLRADLQKRLAHVKQRAIANARYQEGDAPDEQPAQLVVEYERLDEQLRQLVFQINRTNLLTEISPGVTMTAALANRDRLGARRGFYGDLADAASTRADRYTRTELKYVASIDTAAMRQLADDSAQQYRELDTQIQATNWSTELFE